MAKKVIENPAKGVVDLRKELANVDNNETTKKVPDGSWTHFTVICSIELTEKIRAIAQKEGFTVREVVEKYFSNGINAYESKYGEIKVKPAKKKRNIDDVL